MLLTRDFLGCVIFYVIYVFCRLVDFVRLSVPVQVINNNNNTSICKAHNVSIRDADMMLRDAEAPAVARWRGWLEG